MRYAYAKMTFHIMLVSFLALILIGCGESGTPGGSSGPGVTASIGLSLGNDSLPADGSSSTAVTATLKDSSGNAVTMGTSVVLSTTIGKFSNGQKEYRVSTSDESGVVTVSLISETKTGDAVVKATANKITQSIKLTFIDGGIATPAYLTLGASTNKVKTDNSDSAEITAIVLDKDRAPIKGISVAFSTTAEDGSAGAGQLSASKLVTDENGSAVVKFSSGVGDKRNQVVTITVTVEGLPARQIPIQVTGSYITISAQGETNIPVGGASSNLKIVVSDASNAPVYDVPVTLALSSDSTGTVTITPASGKTDINGEFQAAVTGATAGTAVVEVEALGALGTQTYIVDDPNKIFRIIEPADEIVSLKTNNNLTVKVTAGDYDKVVFATTIGTWDGGTKRAVEKSAVNGEATAVLTSSDAGTATVHVYPVGDPSISDSMKVAISAPSSEASKINLQAASSVVAPSTDQVKNSVVLTAKVTNSKNQVVSGAPVLFSIQNPTGGGEYIVPAISYTDAAGIATSVFTSGSLVAGADGVKVTAELINVDASDTVSIIISGKAASLVIGRSTMLESINNDTAYKLPMSILVTDANGSPVKQALVSLNLWPTSYRIGYWEENYVYNVDLVNVDLVNDIYCIPVLEGERFNEDANKNLLLDDGEDINMDGELTPPISSAGAVPQSVVTDENGVANFDLTYMKSSAQWIKDAITATTVVSGTESSVTYSFVLPWSEYDADECLLPDSPYAFENVEPTVKSISISSGIPTNTIPADGGSTAVIRATVFGSDDKPMAGQPVVFTTTLGTFTSGSTVTTDNFGVATITLKASTFPGMAIVTAESSGFTDQLEITMTSAGLSTITLTAIPDSVVPEGSAMLIAAVKDRFGNPVAGEQINFQILQNISGATLSGATKSSDANGQATVEYTAGALEGTDQIQVTANSNQSINKTTSIRVKQAAAIVGSIDLISNLESIPADGTSSAQITATILDTAGMPVPKGTAVAFSTTLGSFPNNGSSFSLTTADNTGKVITSIKSGTNSGTAIVTAISGGVTQSVSVKMESGGLPAGNVDLRIVDTVLKADGSSTTQVIATVKTSDNQVVEGAEVVFSATAGSITTPHTTDATGQAIATLTSDRYNRTIVEVTAASQGESKTATLSFSGVTMIVEASPESLLAGPDSLTEITATLLDAAEKPIADEPVVITTSRGLFNGSAATITVNTNASGVARTTMSSTDAGSATVTASARNASGSAIVTFGSYLLKWIHTDQSPIAMGESTRIYFQLLENGIGLNGKTLNFSSSLGTISSVSAITATHATYGSGVASVELSSGNQTGQAVVDAKIMIEGILYNAQTSVPIISEDAAKIVLKPNPGIINVSNGVSTIRANVYDAEDNPVPFTDIFFRINDAPGGGEYLSSSTSRTDINGIAEIQFFAGAIPSINVNDVEIEASTDSSFPSVMAVCNLTIAGPVSKVSVSVNLQELPKPAITEGHLKVGVSAIVTDINGNPVADGTKVYFGVLSIAFDEDRDGDFTIDCFDDMDNINQITCPGEGTLGVAWFSDDVNQDGLMYQTGGVMAQSEDANNNGILDSGEDKNGNGMMDPAQGCTINTPMITTSGVATSDLIYPMSFADNIKVRVSAEAGGVSNFYDYVLLCTEDMVGNGTCGLGY